MDREVNCPVPPPLSAYTSQKPSSKNYSIDGVLPVIGKPMRRRLKPEFAASRVAVRDGTNCCGLKKSSTTGMATLSRATRLTSNLTGAALSVWSEKPKEPMALGSSKSRSRWRRYLRCSARAGMSCHTSSRCSPPRRCGCILGRI